MAVPPARGLERCQALAAALADGKLRSIAALAHRLGCPAAEIESAAAALAELGVPSIEPGGLKLAAPVELLDAARIRAALSPRAQDRLAALETYFAIDSTNTLLLGRPPAAAGRAEAALAEIQLAGRGRRGRPWMTPFGGSIALSLGWPLRDAGEADPTLSLAVGVAVARALERHGARRIGLKWPNDIWFEESKLGGILVELKTAGGGAGHVVIGVGLNLSLSADTRRAIEARGVRVASVADAAAAAVGRNALAATLLTELLSMLESFEQRGFAAFREEWASLDALGGRRVRILLGEEAVEGVSRGVDADGALLVESAGELRRFVSGEATLRAEQGEM